MRGRVVKIEDENEYILCLSLVC